MEVVNDVVCPVCSAKDPIRVRVKVRVSVRVRVIGLDVNDVVCPVY